MCPAKDLAGVKTSYPLRGGHRTLGGLPTFAVSLSLHRSLPAILGSEGNRAERPAVLYFLPTLYFKGLFRFFP